MSIVELVRPEIRALSPYEAAQQVDNTIRLNANEAPWTSSGDRFRRPLNRYPEIRPVALTASLASYFGCDTSQLLLTRGSSDANGLGSHAHANFRISEFSTPSSRIASRHSSSPSSSRAE